MGEDDAVAFGEKVLALLEQGRFTTTYKYAVLLGLIDVCLEGVDGSGRAPQTVHPGDLSRRVIELYWPQTMPFGSPTDDAAVLLRQTRFGVQAEVVEAVLQRAAAFGAWISACSTCRAAPTTPGSTWRAERRPPSHWSGHLTSPADCCVPSRWARCSQVPPNPRPSCGCANPRRSGEAPSFAL